VKTISKILVTGATGNVGREVVKFLKEKKTTIFAADLHKESVSLMFGEGVGFRKLDFYDESTFEQALDGIDIVFLMRPPQIGDVKTYMFPFIDLMKEKKIKLVVTLSIADANPMVPHYKIENYIKKIGITYTHIRAGYFMQNLSTTHKEVIQKEKDLFIPAGNAKFSFTDVKDIGEVAAFILFNGGYNNQTIHITGSEVYDLSEVAKMMSEILKLSFTYSNPSGKAFKKKMNDYGISKEMIRIMRLIYFGARVKKSDTIYTDFERIMKKKPRTLEQYIVEYSDSWK